MSSLFKSNVNTIISFLNENPDIKLDSYNKISYLMQLVVNKELTKMVMSLDSQRFIKLNDALSKYVNDEQILVYLDNISTYILFESSDIFEEAINTIKSVFKGNIFQLIKKDFKQKLTMNFIDENYVRVAKEVFNGNITIEQNNSFMWEVTIDDKLYPCYEKAKVEYEKFVTNSKCVGKAFIATLIRKNIYEYTRYNINSVFTSDVKKVIKNFAHEIKEDQLKVPVEDKILKRNQTMMKNNQHVIDWVTKNPPNADEQKLDYYDRYAGSTNDKAVTKPTFTICVKSLGYVENKCKSRIYWELSK